MGKLVDGDDGLPVEEVGSWATEKHELLCRYIDISRAVRSKWLGKGRGGATYIDVFCGPGRAKIRKKDQFIDGSCVAAWRKSVAGGAPFSAVYIADADKVRLDLARRRLLELGAPVTALHGPAVETINSIASRLSPYGLHFAFVDPFNLGAFDFEVVRRLSLFKYIDMLVHVSKMDMQRNLGFNVSNEQQAFETFAPGWRAAVNVNQRQSQVRREVFQYWRTEVGKLGVSASTEMRLVTGSKNQPLYWLLLAAKHQLAHEFWKVTAKSSQGEFEF